MSFRDLNPMVKVALLLALAAIPFFIFVATRSQPLPADETPAELPSPDTPLAFPFDDGSTTTSTEPVSSTTSTSRPRPQCSDGRDNDRDGRIDFPRDPGCTSRLDNSEFNTVPTTRAPTTTTRAPTTTTRAPTAPATTKAPTAPVTTTNSGTAN